MYTNHYATTSSDFLFGVGALFVALAEVLGWHMLAQWHASAGARVR